MVPGFEDRQSSHDFTAANESLVDIHTEPAPPAEPGAQVKPRRRRLSDVQNPSDDAPPEPKPQRARLPLVVRTAAQEPPSEPQQASRRARLNTAQPQGETCVAVLEPGVPNMGLGVKEPRPDGAGREERRVEPAKLAEWITEARARQSLPIAAAGGLLAAVVGAMIWAVITVATNVQIGWMAVGVGFLVGGVVRTLGRGIDKSFGYLGAGLALFACVLGNYLTNCIFIAREVGLPMASVLTQISPAAVPGLMIRTLHPLDLLFYGLAVYEGYRFSFRRITEAEVSRIRQPV